MSDAPVVRASDAERERAVEHLRAASAEGRLTLEELSERVTAAYEARTDQELDALTDDLPIEADAAPPASRRTHSQVIRGIESEEERKQLGS